MAQEPATCQITALDHLVLTVSDIPATVTFYTRILGMRHTRFAGADGTNRSALFFGAQKINLHQSGAEFDPKARAPLPGSADLCFLTHASLSNWQTHLSAHNIPVEDGPVPRTGATGPVMSLYIRDPDGNLIEISNPRDTQSAPPLTV